MTFKHRDTEIRFSESTGEFTATVDGKFVAKPSLAAMKKHIDAAGANEFRPFTAFEYHYSTPSLDEVTVIGVEKSRRKYRSDEWRFQSGGTASIVAENTPENAKRIKQYLKKREEKRKLVEKLDDDLEKIRESIVTMTP